jgi:hypothetical protein
MKPTDTADDPTGPPPDPALERLLYDSRALVDASPEVQERAMAIFAARRQAAAPTTPRAGQANWGQRLAQLLFDSLAPAGAPYALGMRGAGGSERQWLFSAGEHDVDLRLDHDGLPGERPWRLSGQVLGPDGARCVRLIEDASSPRSFSAGLGGTGDFGLDRLPSGRWQLFIDFDGWSIVLPAIAWPPEAAG